MESDHRAIGRRGSFHARGLDRCANVDDALIVLRQCILPNLLKAEWGQRQKAIFSPDNRHCFLPALLQLLLTQSVEDMTAMAEIISLSKVRKRKARDAKEEQAAENRIKFGRTKAEREKIEAGKALDAKKLDAHKRDDESEP
jgi:hypothetical protein